MRKLRELFLEELHMKARIPKYNLSIIDGTIYVVENAVSSEAKETAYVKLKRMVLADAEKAAKNNKKTPEFIDS